VKQPTMVAGIHPTGQEASIYFYVGLVGSKKINTGGLMVME